MSARTEPIGSTSKSSAVLAELMQEAAVTRRVLERVPEKQLEWRPHAKSRTLGDLAHHVAALPRGITQLLTELRAGLPEVPSHQPESAEEILAAHDSAIEFASDKIATWGDAGLAEIWTLTHGESVLLQLPRSEVVRTLVLNHAYHHRGQLSVYLRLLDVPIPPIYGPTADERPF